MSPTRAAPAVILLADLPAVFDALRGAGYTVVGPTVRDAAVVYDELASAGALPVGWGDEQDGGRYRLRRRGDDARFGYAVGPHSWKRFPFPPRRRLWSASRTGDGFEVEIEPADPPRYAFLGVRPCELAALVVQDRVFVEGAYPDPHYSAARADAFVIAVECGDPAGTCFCVSMGTGPEAGPGHDLSLTELLDAEHRFFVRVGSDRGAELLAAVPHRAATAEDAAAAQQVTARAATRMGRTLDTDDLPDLLARTLEHPRWDDVASRCLTCANCTMVCPTCFCSATEDVTDLTGNHAERWRRWDSCFTLEFSHLHGGDVRASSRARYRQWLTHKLGTWWDQFGTSGCVGCGRCITWCPVGIDLTEEVRALRAEDLTTTGAAS